MELRFRSDWFSVQIPVWEQILGPLRGTPDLHFLEIGSYEGRSACWLLQNILTHASARLTCIDLFEINDECLEISATMGLKIDPTFDLQAAFDWNIRALQAEHKVTALKGSSRELLRTLPLRSFDCMYIDGSHTSISVLSDAVLAWDLLKTNGLLMFDDYEWTCFPEEPLKNPKTGIDAFLTCFAGEYELVRKDYQVIVRKIERKTPSPPKPPIVIACSTDEHYAPGLAVMVRSVLDHHRGTTPIELYVLETDLSQGTRERLLASWKDSRLRVTFLQPPASAIEHLNRNKGVHQAMYFYLLLPILLPQHSKVLKMDADMLVLEDIEELWNTDLRTHPMAACQELGAPVMSNEWALPNYKELGIPPDAAYCNAGLMLLNLDIWRKEGIAQKIIDHTKRYENILLYWDQDGVNAVLAERWLQLDAAWNTEVEGLMMHGWVPEDPAKVQDLIARAKVIHFIVSKPWNTNCKHPKKELFCEVLKRTAWKPTDDIPHRRPSLPRRLLRRVRRYLLAAYRRVRWH